MAQATDQRPGYLILDTESVPDGDLIAAVKYAGDNLSAEQAIDKAQAEAREASRTGSDFLPVSFQIPVAVCVIRVGTDLRLQRITCLDAPRFDPAEIARKFWIGVELHKAKLVTFNGRGFDLPLMEMAAFRHGLQATTYYQQSRNRFQGNSIDLLDWFNNVGACRHVGGLNLLAKMLGLPGKCGVAGDQVYAMWKAGKLQEINDYCLFDTLDTYFVFLRTRVMIGEIDLEQERDLRETARRFIEEQKSELSVLSKYLEEWSA